jgi:hypothetical protein
MKDIYLEITYRKGRPLAAYLFLRRDTGTKSALTKKIGTGLVADFDAKGRPIGVEITSPTKTTIAAVNAALRELDITPLTADDLAPLKAA